MFAFHLKEHECSTSTTSTTSEREGESSFNGGGGIGNAGEGREAGSAQVSRADGAVGKTELGVVLMKFEHTRQPILGVCCSQEQVYTVLHDMMAYATFFFRRDRGKRARLSPSLLNMFFFSVENHLSLIVGT